MHNHFKVKHDRSRIRILFNNDNPFEVNLYFDGVLFKKDTAFLVGMNLLSESPSSV